MEFIHAYTVRMQQRKNAKLDGGYKTLTQKDNECDVGCVTGLTSVEQASHSCTTDTAPTEEACGPRRGRKRVSTTEQNKYYFN